MPRLADKKPEKRFTALFVGPKNSGKSSQAATFIPDNPNELEYYFDFDDRMNGVIDTAKKYGFIDLNRIFFDTYPPKKLVKLNPDGTDSLAERVNKKLDEFMGQVVASQLAFGTVIWDSMTAFNNALVQEAIPLTHAGGKGRKIGAVAMTSGQEYGYESISTYGVINCLKSLPIQNLIVTAHVVDKYGKEKHYDDEGKEITNDYEENVVIGEKLSLRDKIAANIGIHFDHIWRFDRKMLGGMEKFSVEFRGDLACTSYNELPNRIDITGKSLKEVVRKCLSQQQAQ